MAFLEWRSTLDPLRNLGREMDRLLDSLGAPLNAWRSRRQYPPVNIYETEDAFTVVALVPGVSPQEIEITLSGDSLTLKGQRRPAEIVSEERYRRQERPTGAWTRVVPLAARIDPSGVTAESAYGVLRIQVPKAPEIRPRQIPVTAAAAEDAAASAR